MEPPDVQQSHARLTVVPVCRLAAGFVHAALTPPPTAHNQPHTPDPVECIPFRPSALRPSCTLCVTCQLAGEQKTPHYSVMSRDALSQSSTPIARLRLVQSYVPLLPPARQRLRRRDNNRAHPHAPSRHSSKPCYKAAGLSFVRRRRLPYAARVSVVQRSLVTHRFLRARHPLCRPSRRHQVPRCSVLGSAPNANPRLLLAPVPTPQTSCPLHAPPSLPCTPQSHRLRPCSPSGNTALPTPATPTASPAPANEHPKRTPSANAVPGPRCTAPPASAVPPALRYTSRQRRPPPAERHPSLPPAPPRPRPLRSTPARTPYAAGRAAAWAGARR